MGLLHQRDLFTLYSGSGRATGYAVDGAAIRSTHWHMRGLFTILTLIPFAVTAQRWHDLPPPVNLVGAGYNLEHAVKSRKAATIGLVVGGALTGILATTKGSSGTAAPLVAGGLTLGFGLGLNLHSLKWEDRAADLIKCGYSPDELYEMVPDSVGDARPRKMRIPALIDGTPVKLPARMR